MPNRTLPALLAGLMFVTGCTSLQPSDSATDITPAMLLDAELLRATAMRTESGAAIYAEVDVLALDGDMQAFLTQFVDLQASDYIKLDQLIHALISDGTFGLVYDNRTRTASETFQSRAGNCLSFTNMFVAFSREAGLEVSYQEVDIPPDWTADDGTFMLNRHVNVSIDLGMAGEHIVDFNIDDFRATYDRRIIADERALAHFYNNKGVEKLQQGDMNAALVNLRRSLDRDRTFGPAWSNLGTLYRRQGLPAYAEASYLQALVVNRNEYVAMSNLASLYAELGDTERSAYFEKRTTLHRMRNPYYRFNLAREAFLIRDYDTAISNLEYAIRRKEWEDSFYFLLGLSYLQKGDEKRARKWLNKAEEVAQSDALKRNYQSKIDLLLSAQ